MQTLWLRRVWSLQTADRNLNESKLQGIIESGYFDEAQHVLSSIPNGDRNAEWYFLSAIANYNVGNRIRHFSMHRLR
jgi:hypothetical protein